MRTPQGIADLITAQGQHASLSFLNYALEVCVANGGSMRGSTSHKEEETFDIKNIQCAGDRHGASCPEKSKMSRGSIFHDSKWELGLAQRLALCCEVKCLGWIRVTLINFSVIFQQIWQVADQDTLKLLYYYQIWKKLFWVKFQAIPMVIWISNCS